MWISEAPGIGIILILTHLHMSQKRSVCTFNKRCDSLNDDATVIFNIKGNVGETSPDLKRDIDFFREGEPDDEYPRAIEEQVENDDNDERWRLDRMFLREAYLNERLIGKYSHVVSMIRGVIGEFTTKQMAKYFKVDEEFCERTVECIKEHPEWNDDQVIEDVDWDE